MKTPRYSKKTVQKFLDYLAEIELSVYGPVFEEGIKYSGCMDYDAETIIDLRRGTEKGIVVKKEFL